jgi:LysM repeat protein
MIQGFYSRYLRKCKSTAFLIFAMPNLICAQNLSNRFFSSGYEIVVDVLPGNDIFYSHTYDKGISIYSLAEVFQVEPEKVLRINKFNPTQPNNDGKIVKIPVRKDLLITNPSKKRKEVQYIPLYYQVKKGESLYRISTQYFDTDVSSLISINHKDNLDIKTGEKLLVAWFPLRNIKKTEPSKSHPYPVKATPKAQSKQEVLVPEPKKETMDKLTEEDPISIVKYYLSDVIGMWDRTSIESKSYFVLHDEARPGTMMDVYNPMLKKHIRAKVLGKIPLGTYQEDIALIISSAIAKDLGILDVRFKVNIKFEK